MPASTPISFCELGYFNSISICEVLFLRHCARSLGVGKINIVLTQKELMV